MILMQQWKRHKTFKDFCTFWQNHRGVHPSPLPTLMRQTFFARVIRYARISERGTFEQNRQGWNEMRIFNQHGLSSLPSACSYKTLDKNRREFQPSQRPFCLFALYLYFSLYFPCQPLSKVVEMPIRARGPSRGLKASLDKIVEMPIRSTSPARSIEPAIIFKKLFLLASASSSIEKRSRSTAVSLSCHCVPSLNCCRRCQGNLLAKS